MQTVESLLPMSYTFPSATCEALERCVNSRWNKLTRSLQNFIQNPRFFFQNSKPNTLVQVILKKKKERKSLVQLQKIFNHTISSHRYD